MKTSRQTLSACLLLGVVLTVFTAGCASRSTPKAAIAVPALTVPEPRPMDPALLKPPAEPFTLGPGDRLDVELLGDITTRSRLVVGPDGKIYFYVLPGLDVWGLSLAETQALLAREMQKFVREKPPLALTLRSVESQRIWILGRLGTPGVYPLTGPTTLLEAISLAGGPISASSFTSLTSASGMGSRGATDEAADLSRSFVIRDGKLLPVDFNRLLREGDLSHNIYLRSDDFIYLPSAKSQTVHVIGAVTQSRAVNYTSQLTLTQAVASAGGTIKDAYVSGVAIVRGSLSEPKLAVMDYQEIMHGHAPDVLLEPNDIVYVPFTPYRTLTRYTNLILDTFVRAVGANEGSRAVDRNASVGVNVPIGGGL